MDDIDNASPEGGAHDDARISEIRAVVRSDFGRYRAERLSDELNELIRKKNDRPGPADADGADDGADPDSDVFEKADDDADADEPVGDMRADDEKHGDRIHEIQAIQKGNPKLYKDVLRFRSGHRITIG